MRKIPSLFKRDYAGNRLVFDEVVEGCEWVQAGEGIATQKHDGTCCLIREGQFYKRYELKKGKSAPFDFTPAQEPDPITGYTPGWVLVKPEDRWHWEGFHRQDVWEDGTYELCGPKINSNPEKLPEHRLIRHGSIIIPEASRTFNELRISLESLGIEGIVWHHPNGRMCKIKARDFGLQRR